MSEIRRVPFESSGLHDAVEMSVSCAITRYKTQNGIVIGTKGAPRIHPCKIMASYEVGTLSISVPETSLMVCIRLDEAMAVLCEAARTSHIFCGEEQPDVEEGTASQG